MHWDVSFNNYAHCRLACDFDGRVWLTRIDWIRERLIVGRDSMKPGGQVASHGFLATRSIGCYAQLAVDAPTESLTAMRTTIRACLLQSVNDDPADLLQGEVIEFPGAWQAGAILTVNLNQVPNLSAQLRVYDEKRRLIGEGRVADSRDRQAQVEIVRTYVSTPAQFSSWTLVGTNR